MSRRPIRIRPGRLRATLIVVLATVATTALGGGATAVAAPLTWSSPSNPFRQSANPSPLSAVSCPTTSFCAATDGYGWGDVLTSSDPAGGARTWTATSLPNSTWVSSIVCPSAKLCVAGDGNGDIWTSTDPTGGYRRWHSVHLENPTNTDGLSSLACPSANLCIAVDVNGNAWTSSNPTGGRTAWHHDDLPYDTGQYTNNPVVCTSTSFCWFSVEETSGTRYWTTTTPLTGGWTAAPTSVTYTAPDATLSCPTSSFCVQVNGVRVDGTADATVSTGPSSSGPWTTGRISAWSPLTGVDCLAKWTCVGADASGNILTSRHLSGSPAHGVSWAARHIAGQSFAGGVACPTAKLCISGTTHGVLISHTPTGPAGGWHDVAIPAASHSQIDAVSCPSAHLCVAATDLGTVLTTTNPTGPGSGWTVRRRLPSQGTRGGNVPETLTFVTCPSTHLCFAGDPDTPFEEGDIAGMLLVSTNPTKAGSWHGSRLGFASVSCPSRRLCFALEGYAADGVHTNGIEFSRNPTGGASTWHKLGGPITESTWETQATNDLSCPRANFCVVAGVDHSGLGAVAVSTNPTKRGSWREQPLSGSPLMGVSCTAARRCVAYSELGELFFGS